MLRRVVLWLAVGLGCIARPLVAQHTMSAADSTLVWRILLAEDQRDASNPALTEGTATSRSAHSGHRSSRGSAHRRSEVRFARFFSTAPGATGLHGSRRGGCGIARSRRATACALRGALADSVWAIRLHAIDLVGRDVRDDSRS